MKTPKPSDNSGNRPSWSEFLANPVIPDEVRAKADAETERRRELNAPGVPVVFPAKD